MIHAKLAIFWVLLASFLFTHVDTSAKKKKRDSDSFLDTKDLFFGGVSAGLSLSQIDGDNFSGYHKANFNFSAVGHTQLGNGLTISTELTYNQKGSQMSKSEPPLININGDTVRAFDISLNYAEIAILGNIFDKKGNNAGMGLAYGRLLNSSEKVNGMDADSQYPFNKNTVDWVLNGNLLISQKVPGLFFNLRFQFSIIPVRSDYNGPYGHGQQVSKQLLLRLNYIF